MEEVVSTPANMGIQGSALHFLIVSFRLLAKCASAITGIWTLLSFHFLGKFLRASVLLVLNYCFTWKNKIGVKVLDHLGFLVFFPSYGNDFLA